MTIPDENRVTVLIVEDSRTQAEYLQHILETEGYGVVVAADGTEALEKIKVTLPAIILTDIIMPGMDGYDLCRAIKQNADLAQIPVILVTQLFDPADLIKGLQAGADNIIIKPFEPHHVISRITSTLQLPGQMNDGRSTLEVSLDGKTHHIPANQLQTPAILLSSYDHVSRKNTELREAYERLAEANEALQMKIEKLQSDNEKLLSSSEINKNVADLPAALLNPVQTDEHAQKLRESEERFRMVTELSPFPLSLIDGSGNPRFINKKFEQLFGYTIKDIPCEKDWFARAFCKSPEPEKMIRAWNQDLEGAGEGFSHKFPITCKDGTLRQVFIHPITLLHDERFVVYEDLTHKTESDRLRSVLASIVNSSNDAIIGKTLDGTILSWNKAAERYYGYLAEEVIGKSIDLIVPAELRDQLALFLRRAGNGETIDRFDTIRLRKDGSRIEVCVTLAPIRNEEGHIIGISTIAQNIAERKKYEVSRMFNQQILHRR